MRQCGRRASEEASERRHLRCLKRGLDDMPGIERDNAVCPPCQLGVMGDEQDRAPVLKPLDGRAD